MSALAVCGVAVTYQPGPEVVENLRAMVSECGRVAVIDNASSASSRKLLGSIAGIELIAQRENTGVAAALNTGARWAAARGYEWIVTFDQDSRPQAGMVAAMVQARARNPQAAVIGPCIIEGMPGARAYRWARRHARVSWLFERATCEEGDLPEVTEVITSGSMVDLATWQSLGGFDEDLFIDYVDVDYCLKVGRINRKVMVAADARLNHKLGARESAQLLGHDFRPMHHAAFRHYYMSRNRVRLWRRHALAVPHWAVFDFSFAVYNAFRVIAFERNKWGKLKAMALGTWDGLRGRFGPCQREVLHPSPQWSSSRQ